MTGDICRCRPGSGRLCEVCLAANAAPHQRRQRPPLTDAIRDELRLLGLTDHQIEQLR
jgi:hypothetical protein